MPFHIQLGQGTNTKRVSDLCETFCGQLPLTILFCWSLSFVVVLSWVLAQDQCVSFLQLIHVCGCKQTSALSTAQQDLSDEKEGQRHSSHDEWKK